MQNRPLDYFAIIQKYISPSSLTYRLYMTHVALVTAKALEAARHLNLSFEQLRFIEEASMLHDIGIVRVDAPELGCTGNLPYIAHIIEGGRMLREEGLPDHARVAESHIGTGITRNDIIEKNLSLPLQDFVPVTLEEEIISWADLFYGKNPDNVWRKRKRGKIRRQLSRFGEEHVAIFNGWDRRFRS